MAAAKVDPAKMLAYDCPSCDRPQVMALVHSHVLYAEDMDEPEEFTYVICPSCSGPLILKRSVIEELHALVREMREADARGERLGLTPDELAFHDALEVNGSAVAVMGDETLRGSPASSRSGYGRTRASTGRSARA